MRRTRVALVVCLAIFTIPATGWSKGKTIKIVIKGDHISSPIEITNPDIVDQFNIWNGPGVGTRGPDGVPHPPAYLDPNRSAGRFIDWPKGAVEQYPDGLKSYDVKFHIAGRDSESGVIGTYHVLYRFNPSVPQGYMYLPTWQERNANTQFIVHGVEGAWFYASTAWEELVRPIIGNAIEAFAHSEDLPPSIIRAAESVTKKRLDPWLTDFLSRPKPGDPIQEYEIVSFDDDLFSKIRSGQEKNFQFHVNDKYSFLITAESVLEFDGGWLLNGYLPNRPDMSAAKIIIADDGSKMGDVFVMRIGRFEIDATSELPYHIVYLSTGTYDID